MAAPGTGNSAARRAPGRFVESWLAKCQPHRHSPAAPVPVKTTCGDGRAEPVGGAAARTATAANESARLALHFVALGAPCAPRACIHFPKRAARSGSPAISRGRSRRSRPKLDSLPCSRPGDPAKSAVRVADTHTAGTLFTNAACAAAEGGNAGFHPVFTV